MEQNNKNNIISKKIETNNLKIINDQIIDKLNKIIISNNQNIDNEKIIIQKLKTLKKLAKKKYKNIKTLEEKQYFLMTLLYNIAKLLNELNYNEVYNSDTILNINLNNYSSINITEIATIKKSFIKWWDCNIQLLNLYNILRDITNNDKQIKYSFLSDYKDNHWKLIISINNDSYEYHRSKNHYIWYSNNLINTKKTKKDLSLNDFLDTKKYIWLKQKKVVYRMGYNYFKIKKIFWIFILAIKSDNKELAHINIRWFKRLTKNISKINSSIILWTGNDFKNKDFDEIISLISSKLKNKNDILFLKNIIRFLDKEKIVNMFN